MRAKAVFVAFMLLLVSMTVLGQKEKLIKIDGEGDFHLGTRTIIGDHILEKGMYRVTITHVNQRHLVTLYNVPMNKFGKGMWPGARKELFRVEVRSEPGIAVRKTTLKVLKREKFQLALEITFKDHPTRYILLAGMAAL